MQALNQQAGTIDSLYRGDWKKNLRHGFGIQLYPNGARYIGNWKKGLAEGFGRLEFIDGTFYEGNFSKNYIQWGKLYFFNGTYFEGFFDGTKDLFKNGRIMFRDGEIFTGTWSPDGIVLSGFLQTEDGKKLPLINKDIIREQQHNISGKIIYWKKGIIYEGGLRKHNYDQKGFVYGNFMHPFYFECNMKNGKYNGRYFYNSLFYGFSTHEFYSKGKEIGTWRYMTSKGYEYVADTSTKNQIVKFPFLNRDHYEGEINMWCEKILLVLGIYNMWEEDNGTYKQIRVINCDSITTQRDIRKRIFTFDKTSDLIMKKRKDFKRNTFSNECGTYYLEDGASFKGHVINDYVHCHRKDLLRLMNFGQRDNKNFPIQRIDCFFNAFNLRSDKFNINNAKFFRGTLINGNKTGYCHVVSRKGDEFRGFYTNDKQCGHGYYVEKNHFSYIGSFRDNNMNGHGTMMIPKKELLKGEFFDGIMKGLGYIKYFDSSIEFFGQIMNNLKNGRGVLKFKNNYKFEGIFKNDEIDTSEQAGKLINKEEEKVEEGTFLPSTDQTVGLLQTSEGHFYVLDFKNGVVKKTS